MDYLRCYGKKDKGTQWYSVCLDLNLVAYGDSLFESKNKLHAMMADYLQEATNEDKEFIADLIPRKAPLYFFAEYYWLKISRLFHGRAKTGLY
jgi:hypothetical protein